jgi:hypothetical protein
MAMAAILDFFSTPQKLPHTTVDMETKKGGFKIFLDSFHQT